MNRKSALRVMVMEGMVMVSKIFCYYLQLMLLQPCHQFHPMPPCSCLTCGISVGEKIFIFGCGGGLPHVERHTSL